MATPAGEHHLASLDVWWRYPRAGDPLPPIGTKLLLLTKGGICIVGQWISDGFFVAWSPMPARNKEKEALWQEDVPPSGDAING